jgi:hypothetical protein
MVSGVFRPRAKCLGNRLRRRGRFVGVMMPNRRHHHRQQVAGKADDRGSTGTGHTHCLSNGDRIAVHIPFVLSQTTSREKRPHFDLFSASRLW